MRTAFWLLIAFPGSFAGIAWITSLILRKVKGWREEDEDAERAIRIQREYMVPEDAVEVPKGRRTSRRELPEITSNYKEVGRWL
jgi:hypothetical protein